MDTGVLCFAAFNVNLCFSIVDRCKLWDYSSRNLPETSLAQLIHTSTSKMNAKDCESRYLNNCSCTAYSYVNASEETSGTCLNWHGDFDAEQLAAEFEEELDKKMKKKERSKNHKSTGSRKIRN